MKYLSVASVVAQLTLQMNILCGESLIIIEYSKIVALNQTGVSLINASRGNAYPAAVANN